MVRITKAKPEVYPIRPDQPWELSDGTRIIDACYDSHKTRLGRAHRALNGLLRLIQDAWNPRLGRPEFCTLLIVFPDLIGADANVWMTETVEAVQERLDSYFDEVARAAGCGPLPRYDKIESCSGRSGVVHTHSLVSKPTARLYTHFVNTDPAGGGPGLRLMHLDPWVVLPKRVLITYVYWFKVRDARANRPWLDGRTFEQKEDDTRDAMDAREVAVQQNEARGRRRIKSASRLRHVPQNSEPLNEWTRTALLEIANGTAPCWKGMEFWPYLHRLARHLQRKAGQLRRQAHEGQRKAHRAARLARLAEGRAARQGRELQLRTARKEQRQARRVAARSLSAQAAGATRSSVRWSVDGPLRLLAYGTSSVPTTHPSRDRHGQARARAPPGWPWPFLPTPAPEEPPDRQLPRSLRHQHQGGSHSVVSPC